jgi:hypothetical protein
MEQWRTLARITEAGAEGASERKLMTGDDIDKWIDATLEGWDPSKEGWGPSKFDDVEAGPPLSTEELKRAFEDLAIWHSPLDFRRTVARLHKRCLASEIFNDPKHKFLLDAWVLAELSKHKPFTRLRLAGKDEQWPDGHAQTETGEVKIEVTSAQLPARRLGAEYKLPGRIEYDPVENWVKRAEAIPGALEKAIGDKVKKQYGSPCALVVYLNLSEYGIRQAETEEAIANIKDKYCLKFQYLWILWKGKVF